MKNFGETLKRVRKQKDMTQEQLAEYVNISPQSVSKWETNLTLPDITLIPTLANIFDVSTDFLLGVDIYSKEKCIAEIINRANELHRNGYRVDEARETLRAGLIEYPNSYKIMDNLIRFLYFQIYDENRWGNAQAALTTEIISIGEKILAECVDDECRHSTIQTLCYVYPMAGENEKAVKLAERMPARCLSKVDLLGMIYKGTKKFEQQRDNAFSSIGDVISGLEPFWGPLDDGKFPYTTEECIALNKKIIGFLNFMFEDGDFGVYRPALTFAYHRIADLNAQLGNHEAAIDNLKLAAQQAMLCDEEYDPDPDKEYTSLPFRGMKMTADYIKEENRHSAFQLEKMAGSAAFSAIRESKSFMEIETDLREHIKTEWPLS